MNREKGGVERGRGVLLVQRWIGQATSGWSGWQIEGGSGGIPREQWRRRTRKDGTLVQNFRVGVYIYRERGEFLDHRIGNGWLRIKG